MTRIEGSAPLLRALIGGPGPKAAPDLPFDGALAAPTATSPSLAQQTPSVAMLVVMAASSRDDQRRVELASTARGLDQLAGLHADLVAGAVPRQRLRFLREWLKSRLRPDDPELAAIADEVELRILVELAKMDRDG